MIVISQEETATVFYCVNDSFLFLYHSGDECLVHLDDLIKASLNCHTFAQLHVCLCVNRNH